ncbi:hypothetical protein [Saccharomonospora azurea]|uniref:Uncharacterized protein n=1 Tax=Saccharomonospora azurea NA-128 TaxID=882081 RepID=H8G857_9PSEU|nr:hypothetical protein [Saccharomonospora azurea]EHY89409.1 hypothetical protein SacazDRAFT_02512 [Saccharomonospora azurea NA-128]
MHDGPVTALGPLTDDRPTVTFWRLDDVHHARPALATADLEARHALRHTDPPTLDVLQRVVKGLRRLV